MRQQYFVIAAALGMSISLPPSVRSGVQPAAAQPVNIDELWIDPVDLEQRDLYRGPSEGPGAPDPGTTFTFVRRDTTGRSPGYDVRDETGHEWSVKLGIEASAEVTSSRILWAIGYHQPPNYFVGEWLMTGAESGPQAPGRFRPQVEGKRVIGEWKWNEGPLTGARPMKGLLVAQMMINNWDLKTSNNKLYEISDPGEGPSRMYMVRDLGASLGSNEQAKWLRLFELRAAQGSKNNLEDFEKSRFIDHVEGRRVVFEYSGPNKRFVSNISVDDVRWTAALMKRLSDQQWRDAFRAGGYSEDETERYVTKMKERVDEGLAAR